MKFHATGAEGVEHGYQVAQAAAQPVELPHNERVAVLELLQAAEQGRALCRGSRQAFVFEQGFTSGFFQSREL